MREKRERLSWCILYLGKEECCKLDELIENKEQWCCGDVRVSHPKLMCSMAQIFSSRRKV